MIGTDYSTARLEVSKPGLCYWTLSDKRFCCQIKENVLNELIRLEEIVIIIIKLTSCERKFGYDT